MANLLEEEVEEIKEPHPFDAVLGEKVNAMIQDNTGGNTIGLTYSQFREIKWPLIFPYFICDLIETISGFSMKQELEHTESKKHEERRTSKIHSLFKNDREGKSPTVRRKIEREHQTEKEKKLIHMKVQLTPTVYDELFRFFTFLKYNLNEQKDYKCYLTENSILAHLRRYFGHKTTFLDARLYYMLSDGQKHKRIYFDDFIEKFYTPLFNSANMVKANFMFQMLDFDEDGYLHASDLVQAQQYVDEMSDFGEELQSLTSHYTNSFMAGRGTLKWNDQINVQKFNDILN